LFILLLTISFVVAYIFVMGRYIYWWNRLPKWEIPPGFVPQTKVSVILAARNEAAKIATCLDTLSALDYPQSLLEIIVVDDHSEDATAPIIQSYPEITYLALKDGLTGKKAAINSGIQKAEGELIVTTDADCLVPVQWLLYLVSLYETKEVVFIAAPVRFYDEQNSFERFQSLDFMGMMGIAGAGIEGQFMNMCNGANLAYSKAAFRTVGGFEGIDHLASGDDMLLMEKIAQHYPNKLAYLKNKAAQTRTFPKRTIQAFWQQRLRWATKSSSYQNWQTTATLATVWGYCWWLLITFCLACIGWKAYFWSFVFLFLIKGIMDYLFLSTMATFFDRKALMKSFVPALFMHCLYILLVGTGANIQKEYSWKGRKVR